MKKYLSFILCSSFIFLTGCFSVEEADYTVINEKSPFELRKYAPHIIAETEVKASLEDAGDEAFRLLFKYISGENKSQSKIAMTAPVSQEASSEKIAMTAPVGQQRSKDGWKVSFMMPMTYTMETLPKPNNPKVKLRQIPMQLMASVEYSGFWSNLKRSKQ